MPLGTPNRSPSSRPIPSTFSARWDRRTTLVLALLVAALVASLFWLVNPSFWPVNDAAIYMLCAKSLVAGEGYSYLDQPFIIRPPGFSVLIAPLVAAYGFDFPVLNGFVALWGVAGVALLFVLCRPWIGTMCALGVALCVWLNPGYRSLSSQVMSDIPGMALLLTCLLVERWARRSPSLRRDVVLGSCIGACAYVRTVSVLLVPAIVLVRLVARASSARPSWPTFARTRLLAIVLVPALMLLPWNVRNHIRHPPTPVDQTRIFSYSTGMWHVDRGDPDSPRLQLSRVAGRVPVRFAEAFSALGTRLRSSSESEDEAEPRSSSARDIAAGLVLFALGAAGFARRRDPCAPFLCAVVALVLVYFGFQDRLMLPVYVLSLPAATDLVVWLLSLRIVAAAARGVAAAGLLALAAFDFEPPAGRRKLAEEQRAVEELCSTLAPRLAPDARLAAPMRGWYLSIFLDRPVYSLYFAWERKHDMRAVEELIDRYRIDTVLFSPWTDLAAQPMLPYFREHHVRLDQAGTGVIARVRD